MDRPSLAQRIEEKTNTLIESAQQSGSVDARALRELQRLSTLAEIERSRRPPDFSTHWRLILAGMLTLILCSYLLFHRISAANIALDATVSQLSFVTGGTPAQTLLNESWSLSSLGIERASALTAPGTDPSKPKLQFELDSAYLRLVTVSDAAAPGSILLNGLTLQTGTLVDLRKRDAEDEYELRLTPPAGHTISIKASVEGTLVASFPESAEKRILFARPQQVIASATNQPLILALKPASYPFGLARNIPVTDVRFLELQEYADPGQNLLREVSSIEQATLYQESLNGEKVELRTGEDLHFHDLEGLLRSAELAMPISGKRNAVSLQLSGSVKNVTIGHETPPRSLMPTTLEWLAKRQGLSLFWGTSIYIIGLVTAFSTWWLKRE